MLRRDVLVSALAAGLAAPPLARAQAFPDRPLTLLVPYLPGGGVDATMRALANAAGRQLGQTVVVENRPGASGAVALTRLKSLRPDGYSIATFGESSMRQALLQPVAYDPLKDFAPIAKITAIRNMVISRADAPWRDWRGLINYARANSGKLRYGHPGTHSTPHLAMMVVAQKYGFEWTAVPFRGDAENVTALLGGQVECIITSTGVASVADKGEAVLLGVMSERRSSLLPNLPTMKEQGSDIVMESPIGIAGPAGLEPAIAARLAQAFERALEDAEFAGLMHRLGMQADFLGPADFTAWCHRSFGEQEALLRGLGIPLRQQG